VDEVLTATEVAARLKVTTRSILRWWHAGVLPEPLLPSPRTPRWRVVDIDKWIAGGCRPAQLKAYRRTPRAKKGRGMSNREAAAKMRAEGATIRAIGEALGVSTQGAAGLLRPLPPRLCPSCGKPIPGKGKARYCRAPCLPPSAFQPPTGRPVGRPRTRSEIAGPPRPPRGRGRPRKE
jgi:predicted DNA-binding transcriptional regulator AlpA